MAQEARHRLAREVWLAREGAPLPWNMFQTPLRAARDPRVEAVLGVYSAVHRLGIQLPMIVGAEEQDEGEGREWGPQELSPSSSSSSSSSGSDSSSSSSSSDSSCSSTPDGLKQYGGCEVEAQDGIQGGGGVGSPSHSGEVGPRVVEEEMVTTRSEDAPGEVGGEDGVDGGDGQGEAQAGPAGIPVRLLPRLTPQMIPGWILHGRKKKNSRVKSGPGVQLVARKEFKSYPTKLVRRKNP